MDSREKHGSHKRERSPNSTVKRRSQKKSAPAPHFGIAQSSEFDQEEKNNRCRRRRGHAAKKSSAIPLKKFVEFMMTDDEPRLVEAVQDAILEAAARRGLSRDQYLDLHGGLRHRYYDAIDLAEKFVKRPDKLVECLSQLQIPLESLVSISPRLPPWDTFRPGSTVIVVLGEKFFHDDVVVQQAVGVHDVQAQLELFNLLNEKLQLRFKVEVYLIPLDSSPEEAADDFERLRNRNDAGLIVTIGSPVVNAMVEPLAKTVFDRASLHDPPVRYRWSFDLRKDPYLRLPDEPVLLAPGPGPEGILTRSGRLLPRTPKRAVVEAARLGHYGPFPDAGMLLMDVSCEPYLVAAAGHSGLSTIAACKAIGCVDELFDRFEQSKTPEALLGQNRTLVLLEMDRRKPKESDPELNDLFFNPTFGKGWRFVDYD